MRRDYIDFHAVQDNHLCIHDALNNWARWVRVNKNISWPMQPMFRMYKSKAFQWHAPEYREMVDLIAAQAMEKAVFHLPEKHRTAIRWVYVFGGDPSGMAKHLAVTKDTLKRLVDDGRSMLKNRLHNNS